jgi:hypothetical protein
MCWADPRSGASFAYLTNELDLDVARARARARARRTHASPPAADLARSLLS